MRMAELSRESGVPVATVKYYLREGLLPPGERTGRTQARYGAGHVRRLRLVRAMLEVGGLSLAQVGDVLAAVDSDELGPHKIFGVAQATVTQPGLDPEDHSERATAARKQVDTLVEDLQWRVGDDSAARSALARALAAITELEPQLLAQLRERAELMGRIADLDLALLDGHETLDEQVQVVVVGTVLGDAVNSALRRMAQADRSAHLFEVDGD